MQTDNRLFDDLAKVLNGAAGTLAGMGREAEARGPARARDEFEAVKAMALAAREEADGLRKRLDLIEGGHAVPKDVA